MRLARQLKISLILLVLNALTISAGLINDSNLSFKIKKCAGASRVKLVYTRELGNEGSVCFPPTGLGTKQLLLRYDTETGIEDTVFPGKVQNYQKSLISRDGTKIIYTTVPSMSDPGTIYIIDWDKPVYPGTKLVKGMGSCLWYDEVNKKEYLIYASQGSIKGTDAIYKIDINNVTDNTPFFNKSLDKQMIGNWFAISSDAKKVVLISEWPNVEAWDVTANKLICRIYGCWASTVYDTTGRIVCMNQDHSGWVVGDNNCNQFSRSLRDGITHSNFKVGSYSASLAAFTVGTDDNGPGFIKLVHFNDSLSEMVDTVSVTNTSEENTCFIDVWTPSNSDILYLGPEGPKTIHTVVDTFTVAFKYNKSYYDNANGSVIEYSPDSGKSWHELIPIDNPTSPGFVSVPKKSPNYGSSRYVIPSIFIGDDTVHAASTKARLRIRDYGNASLPKVTNSTPFVVIETPVSVKPAKSFVSLTRNGTFKQIYDIRGKKVNYSNINKNSRASGVYLFIEGDLKSAKIRKVISRY